MEKQIDCQRTHNRSFSRSRFLKYIGVAIKNKTTGSTCDGHHIIGDTIAYFKSGFLHSCIGLDGKLKPAIEQSDGHFEWWENGCPHRIGAPAVIAEYGAWEEFWEHGELIMIHSYGIIDDAG